MQQARGTVRGPRDEHRIVFYGLSTCIWCKRTRQFLEESGLTFDFAYVDLLYGEEREEVLRQVSRWNPRRNFPTIVIDDARSVVGYLPEELKEALDL